MSVRSRVQILVAALLVVVSTVAVAAAVRPSEVTPSRDDDPVLTLIAADGRHELSLADIEGRLPLYDTTLTTAEGMSGRFTGVKLAAFMRTFGLAGARRIRFIAADDYTVFLTPEEIRDGGYLLVTRFDGGAMDLAEKGPLRLIVPAQARAVREGERSQADWIWSIVEIRAR